MTVEPEKYFDSFAKAGANGLTIHVETAPHLHRQLMRIKELGCLAGATMNPSTSLDTVREVASDLDLLLIMSVNPGFGGQQFIPQSLDKIRRARQLLDSVRAARRRLEVDGGVARDTIRACYDGRCRHLRRRQCDLQRGGSGRRSRSAAEPLPDGGRMTAGQQWSVVGAIVAVLGGALWFGSRQLKDELVGVDVGSQAPMFSGATIDRIVPSKSLADYKGKVVLLNVWATWCGPCRTEMPSIEALHKELGPKGLHVVAVSIDDPGKAD